MTTGSLFERLGGEAAIDAAVNLLYEKVLQDDWVKHFFDGVNMDNLRMKQKAFLTMAFGGPNNYTGLDLRPGHNHLVTRGLNDDHFNAVEENIQATLQELNVPADLISEVMAAAEGTRGEVLGK
ncbi:MAG: group 1 truncated hemoglobin [Dehalococcoidia bacterium]